MDSWENLVLQWVNCLHDVDNSIRTIEELRDGEIYYKLISRIASLNCAEQCSKKKVVLQFLKEEYPNFILKNKEDTLESLCIASLVLCRLSLEPVFHKALCTNLTLDAQVKIKSVLELIYPLGKDVAKENLCQIFSIPENPKAKSQFAKPKFILKEFLNSPATRSVQSDKKIHDQTRQLRKLRSDLETMYYEKSELIEDMKNQDKKIKELEQKLQESLSEIKHLRSENFKFHNSLDQYEEQNSKLMQLNYDKELESLEKYVAELQNENSQLQDEKKRLTDELSACQEKYRVIKDKNGNNEQIIESMLHQIEKKDDELAELKVRYEELCCYLKEKSDVNSSNYSFEIDDRIVSELSLNRSEALSSVIEIQLQDSKKEIDQIQKKYRYLNTLLTIFMEEYTKSKKRIEKISAISRKDHSTLVEDGTQTENEDLAFTEEKSTVVECKIPHQPMMMNIGNILLNRNKSNLTTYLNKSKFIIHEKLKFYEYDISWILNNQVSIVKNPVIKNQMMNNLSMPKVQKVDKIDSQRLILKFPSVPHQENIHKKFLFIFQDSLQDILSKLNFTSEKIDKIDRKSLEITEIDSSTDVVNKISSSSIENSLVAKNYTMEDFNDALKNKKVIVTPVMFETMFKCCIIKYLNDLQADTKCSKDSSLRKHDLEALESTWTRLSESIFNNFKIHKVISLLDKCWHFVSESFKDIINRNSHKEEDMKELFVKKDIVEESIKKLQSENLKNVSYKLITAVQLVTILTKDHDDEQIPALISKITKECEEQEQDNLSNKIIITKRKIDRFHYLIELYKKQKESDRAALNTLRNVENKNSIDNTINEAKSLPNKVDLKQTDQFQHYVKELHDKYELKLEKMKDKMKAVYNNQIAIIKKEQEISMNSKLETLQTKLENQCLNHSEELKKYKKHISELTTQLWDVGEKLIIEKQKKEEVLHKCKEYKLKYENIEMHNTKSVKQEQENFDHSISQAEKMFTESAMNKMHNVRGFQIMGNAFKTEDEEGEVFDTTYLADMQRPRTSLSSIDINRLSILQIRNSKCKPHLKSSYPAEMQFHPVPLTEEEIKNGSNGSNPEEFLNDSLSQSLLTGKKVKRKDRARNATETPKGRRFSNIFRKSRLSLDRK